MSSSPISSSSSELLPAAVPATLAEVLCHVDFVIGTGHITVRDCIALQPHSVVRLIQAAGTDVEIRAEGVTVAQGEVAIIDERTALRVSHITAAPGIEEA